MTDGLRKLGTLGYTDTGPVPNSITYTTVVVVHGFGWSGRVFQRLLPLAAKHDTRLVLINRRDFPGSEPYTDEERSQLASAQESPDGQAILGSFMRDRARELYEFLGAFVAQEGIPPANGAQGGIVFTFWSFSGNWLTAFLANLSKFPAQGVDLRRYIRRSVLYDPPYHALGYPVPEDKYHPLEDESIPPQDRPMAFSKWVSGYYTHGNSPADLERRRPLDDPPPTILGMTMEEVQSCFHEKPAGPGGSDALLLVGGIATGLNTALRKSAFFPEDSEGKGDDWADIELRYLWCDRSVYEMPWGTWALRSELDEAKKKGLRMRNVTIVCLPGANHFAHWDQPERLLRALLAEEAETSRL